MKKFLYGLLVTVFSATSILAPLSSASARSIFREQAIQQQQQAEADKQDAMEVLQLLGIELDENAPVLDTRAFGNVVDNYQVFKDQIGAMGAAAVNFFDAMLELMLLANEVDHPAFDELQVSESDLAEIEQARDELAKEFEEIGDEFAQMIIDEMLREVSYRNDYYYDDDYYYGDLPFSAYGYAEPWIAEPGEIVWLRNDSYHPQDLPLTVTWTQIEGPAVTWLKTDHPTDALFIAPDYPEGDTRTSLIFRMDVTDGTESDSITVFVGIEPDDYYDDFDFSEELELPMPAAVSPSDPAVMEIMEMLWLELPADDPLFQNPQFENFVNAYQDLSAIGDELLMSLVNIFESAIDVFIAASQVDHEAFQELYAITDAELEEVELMRNELREELLSEDIPVEELFFFWLLFVGDGFDLY